MGTSDKTKSCVKCRKVLKSTEKVLVCGLWCRKSFHNDCVGLTNTETRIVTCSNERIKFHCETCENRLGIELVEEKETQEPNKLQNSVNNCLLELVQKILKLTNELSNNNSVINNKLDTVISSNTRLEEYILQSPKCLEKRSEETIDDSVDCVESFSAKETLEISEENDTNSDNPNLSSASVPQQTDGNSSLLHIASDDPKHLSDNQEPEGSSNCLQECEMCDDHSGTQDLPSTINKECISSEDFAVCDVFSIAKTEYDGDEKEEIEIDSEECSPTENFLESSTFSIEKIEHVVDGEPEREDVIEECPPSEDFMEGSTFSIEKIEHGVDGEPVREGIMEECSPTEDFIEGSTFSIEKIEHVVDGEPVREDIMEELRPEAEPATTDNKPQSTIDISTEENWNNDERNSLLTEVPQASGKGRKFQRTTIQEVSYGNKSGTRRVKHRCKICKKIFTNLKVLKLHKSLSRCELQHSCDVCHTTFSCKSSLEKHIKMHSSEDQNVCVICNKIFMSSRSLTEHLTLHTGIWPNSCGVCSKRLKSKSSLKEHLRLHSGERPYSCSVCSKTFRHKITMQDHFRLHSSERTFSCSVCNKKFKQRRVLQQHFQVHSDERPFCCCICGKKYKRKHYLECHSRTHFGIKSATSDSRE